MEVKRWLRSAGWRAESTALGFCIASVVANLALYSCAKIFSGMLYMDMVGTAAAALALGPWWGALVGCLTNVALAEILQEPAYLNYTVINVLAGICWGYLGAGRLDIFDQGLTRRRVMGRLLALGVVGSLLTSTIALYTKNYFRFDISPEIPYRLASFTAFAESAIASAEHVYQLLPFDLMASLPDKLLAVALAGYAIYYLVPERFLHALGRKATTWRHSKIPLLLFLLCYGRVFYTIAFEGYVQPQAGAATQVIFLQVAVFAVPLLLGIFFLFRSPNPLPAEAAGTPDLSHTEFDKIYEDAVVLITAFLSILLSTSVLAEGNVENLAKDGMGIIAFASLCGFLPNFIRRYLGTR